MPIDLFDDRATVYRIFYANNPNRPIRELSSFVAHNIIKLLLFFEDFMRHILIKIGLLVVCAVGLPVVQAAVIYDFSYSFNNGEIISGSFGGTADGNLVYIDDTAPITVSSNPPIMGATFFTAHFTIPQLVWINGGAVASFDGTQNNFSIRFIDNSPYHYQRDAFISIPQGASSWQMAPGPGYSNSDFVASANMTSKWTLTPRPAQTEVPEPSSLALIAFGLAAAYTLRNRKKG